MRVDQTTVEVEGVVPVVGEEEGVGEAVRDRGELAGGIEEEEGDEERTCNT